MDFFSLSVGVVFTLSFWMQIFISFIYQIIWKPVLSVSVIRIVEFIPNIAYIGSKMFQPSGLHIYLCVHQKVISWCPLNLKEELRNTYHWRNKISNIFEEGTERKKKIHITLSILWKVSDNICFMNEWADKKQFRENIS